LSSQDRFEPILLDAAAANPLVTLMYGYRIESLSRGGEQDATDAAVVVSDTCSGATSTLVGSALVAADGADSFIRRSLGVAQDGVRGVAHFLNFYFRADIESHVRDRPANFYLIANDALLGAIQPLDIKGRWLCQIEVATDRESREEITPERATDWIRRACGLPDLKIEILAITRWRMNATMAQRFIQGRVILCGDAAQQLPPTGGLGVNTGIQGLHNVMWKLAYVLTGKADMSLIHTYDTERREPTRWVIEQSLDNFYSVRAIGAKMRAGTAYGKDPTALSMTIRRWGNQLGAEFGTVYSPGAIVPDGTAPPQADDPYSDYLPSATPGCRAPHVWLGTDDIQISTLDLVRPSLTLLTADNGRCWVEAAIQASSRTGVRIAYYRLGCPGLEDPGGRFRELYGLARDGAVLIRPDGYVAWRSPTGSADAVNELAGVVTTILDPDPPHL
jgi:2-polyprenyl-6-methoxyphenol hydroxylase-like FAD-dependent oxidoreductase